VTLTAGPISAAEKIASSHRSGGALQAEQDLPPQPPAAMQNETAGWVKSIHETRNGELFG
jgi:hypothetical protein